jgi:hypothetical protein
LIFWAFLSCALASRANTPLLCKQYVSIRANLVSPTPRSGARHHHPSFPLSPFPTTSFRRPPLAPPSTSSFFQKEGEPSKPSKPSKSISFKGLCSIASRPPLVQGCPTDAGGGIAGPSQAPRGARCAAARRVSSLGNFASGLT